MRKAHFITGLVFLGVFIGSGQYMDLAHDHLRGMADGPRMLYRSAHIYMLFGALLNLLLGLYLQLHVSRRARVMQLCGSALLLAAPLFMTLSFLLESQDAAFLRPFARVAIYGTLVGAGLHFFAQLARRDTAQ